MIHQQKRNVMVNIEMIPVGMFQSNCFVVGCGDTGRGVVVDAGDEAETILAAVDRAHLQIEAVLTTHGHLDHVGALAEVIPALGVPMCLHREELETYKLIEHQATMFGLTAPKTVTVDRILETGDKITFGNVSAEVIHAPGHSRGSACFYFEEESPPRIIVGDVLFRGSIGRTDLPGGSYEVMMETLKRVFLPIPDETIVYSGHGPETTVGEEKRTNPFLAPIAREFG
jgi:glyoxylase-like metal-dependent hydrolase (beta-lactamase superfamily II)